MFLEVKTQTNINILLYSENKKTKFKLFDDKRNVNKIMFYGIGESSKLFFNEYGIFI